VRAGELGCVQISEKKRMFTVGQIENFVNSKTVKPIIDRKNSVRVSSWPEKGGKKSLGFVRTALKQEMQSWQ